VPEGVKLMIAKHDFLNLSSILQKLELIMNISKENAESTIDYINEQAHVWNKARRRSKSKSKSTAIRKP